PPAPSLPRLWRMGLSRSGFPPGAPDGRRQATRTAAHASFGDAHAEELAPGGTRHHTIQSGRLSGGCLRDLRPVALRVPPRPLWTQGMTRPALLEAVQTRVLLSDGAMGTQLQLSGLEPGGCGEAWNLDHPDRVLAIQRAYVEAGAECLTTNTFGASRIML